MISYRLPAAFVAALFLPAALPATPYLIQELNPGTSEEIQSVRLRELVSGPDGVSYFSASDPAHGIELWRSDGTPAGTWRVTDVCVGRCSSNPSSVRIFQGEIFFSADDGFSGSELWTTDGTPGSERRVRDLCAGPCSSSPSFFEEAGGELFFFAWNGPRLLLWRTDGTRDGTVRLKHVCTNVDDPGAFCDPYPGLFSAGDRAFFFGKAGSDGLWVTDGTAAGTRLFQEVLPGGPEPEWILSVTPGPGFAWIWTEEGLWRSDGTAAGTHRLLDTASSSRVIVSNGLFFGVTSGGIIRSDGTPAGTYRISVPSRYVNDLVAIEDGILFSVVAEGSNKATSLWRSRGTADTTVQVIDLAPGWISYYDIKSLGNRAIFARTLDYDLPSELWTTDGTAAGTRKLDLPERPRDLDELFPAERQAFFLRYSLPWAPDDLWVSDGSEAGTRRVKDFRVAPGSSGPLEQTVVKNQLLFSARVEGQSAPLFLTDGTAVGTHVVSTDASWASAFTRLGRRLLFQAEERSQDYFSPKGFWETDGTPAGTVQVVPRFYGLRDAVAYGGSLYLSGFELYKTDGTVRGTVQVKDINPYVVDTGIHHLCADEGSYPRPALILKNRLLLTADDGKHGRELWVTDGTLQGTQLFWDLNPLRSPYAPAECIDGGKPRHDTGVSSDPEGFVAMGDLALFTANDGRTGRELWRTDGVPYRTRRVVDLRPGRGGSMPHDLVAFHGLVYFFASAEGTGEALWRTNGTARGTVRVHDLALDGSPSWGRDLMVVGDRLFFVAFNETTGAELWVSGGDASSTTLVDDLNPGPANGAPQKLTSIDGLLVFAADDGLTGLEPWRSDGTPAGTFPVADLAPGPEPSSPGPFTRIRQVLITGADDGARGREPWAIPLDDILRP